MQRTESEIKIDYLTRKLAEANSANYLTKGTTNGDRNVGTRDSEAILVIKRLQEQVTLSSVLLLSLVFFFMVICISWQSLFI